MTKTSRWDADEALTALYTGHYAALVRLAALLVRSSGEAEEIVQDSFVAMHSKWGRLREPDKAVGYLRRTVVNRARSAQRHHRVADKHNAPSSQVAASARSGSPRAGVASRRSRSEMMPTSHPPSRTGR